jgi:hypothetical protein
MRTPEGTMNEYPASHKEMIALIKKISGQSNFIGTPRLYVDLFDGDLVAAVWLNQVVYWDGKTSEPIGFYKTYAEWKRELGLSQYQVRRVALACQRLGFVNITFRKVYGTPKNHYLVVWPVLLKALKATLEKPELQETESSETASSEPLETESSMEVLETESSLSKEEITTNSQIMTILESKLGAYEWWPGLKAQIGRGVLKVENRTVIVSGLGDSAAILADRYAGAIRRALQISTDITRVEFAE